MKMLFSIATLVCALTTQLVFADCCKEGIKKQDAATVVVASNTVQDDEKCSACGGDKEDAAQTEPAQETQQS